VNPPRSLAYSPLFQVDFTWNNTPPATDAKLPGLNVSAVDALHSTTHFDLSLALTENGDVIEGSIGYATDLFDATTIARFASHFGTLLDAFVAQPQAAVSALPLLDASQRRQLLEDFNDTAADFPRDLLIHQMFERQAAARPDAVALVFEDRELTYGELNRRANRLAHYLIAQGVRPDQRVALCAERSAEMVIGLLAILKAGGAYVPLDPAYPRDRLAHMIEDSEPVLLLTQSALHDVLPAQAMPVCLIDQSVFGHQPAHDPVVPALSPASLAYVIYTSGSTGKPKGVMIEHRNACNLIAWAREHFSPTQTASTLFATSINFDLAVYEMFVPLSSGTTITVVEDALAAGVDLDGITHINTVPSAITSLLESRRIPASVSDINLAGEPLKSALVARLFDGTSADRIANLYGPTETTTYSTWIRTDRATGFQRGIGRPIANTQIYILDPHGQPAPVGVAGEIFIGGAGVARGYLNRPELTTERFLADPFSGAEGARMYKTGDLGRWLAEGNIEYLGRNDFQVKIRGFRIELGEIEAALSAIDGVREAVVVAREAESGDKRLVAYLVAQDGAASTAAELRLALAGRLPDYMVPAAFVVLDAFPLTPNGKLDRKALPAPDQEARALRGYQAPQGSTEQAIAEVWQELLGLEQVGREDHFFELGGHSLLVVDMIERLRERAIVVDVRDVFVSPTVAYLAETAQNTTTATAHIDLTSQSLTGPDSTTETDKIEEFRI
jgi:amino acid adenylation domain-containing protein